MKKNLCPCGSNKNYGDCCSLFITHKQIPSTPEELMRSRYTAYSLAKIDYIANTMKAPANSNFNRKAARAWAKRVKWLKLEILNTSTQGDKGFVEFIAYFHENKLKTIHELSEFRQDNGQWYYIDGKMLNEK